MLLAKSSLKSWFLAIRPKTLAAAIVPVWVGCVLAWKHQGSLNMGLALVTALGALCLQIATNLFNDVIDFQKGADTQKRIGPKRMTAEGALSQKTMYQGALAFLLCAVLCGGFLWWHSGSVIVLIGVPSLYFTYGYTGGIWPLAYKGLGEVFVFLFFGVIAVGGTYFVQTGEWSQMATIVGVQVGVFATLLITINNLRDEEEDRQTQKGTIVARLGRSWGLVLLWGQWGVLIGSFYWQARVSGSLPVLWGLPFWMSFFWISYQISKTPPSEAYNRWLMLAALQLLFFALSIHLQAFL